MRSDPLALEGLPPVPLDGGVLRAMRTQQGRLVDLRVRGAPPRVESLEPPDDDPARLARWVELMMRRRGQIAHDLSGPATGVLAALETVLDYEPVEESARELLVEARRGMLRLTTLLEARDGLHAAAVNAVEGRLDDLVRGWATELAGVVDPEERRLKVRAEATAAPVRVDAAALRSALFTFLHNAWRFRQGPEAEVRVEARVQDGWIRVAVIDGGQGLSPEGLLRAGELGFRARASGVGMSLFLLRFALRDRGAVMLRGLDQGCRAEVFLRASTA